MIKKELWRLIAISLFVIIVLETTLFIWIYSLGVESMNDELECEMNICGDDKYTAYFYDSYDSICYCWEYKELTYQEYMGQNG